MYNCLEVKQKKFRSYFTILEIEMLSKLLLPILAAYVAAFPVSPWVSYTPGIDPLTVRLLQSQIQWQGSDLMLYTCMISTDNTQYTLEKVNASASPPALIATYSKTFASLTKGPVLIILNAHLGFSYTDGVEGHRALRINKATMTVLQNYASDATFGGDYLGSQDILIIGSVAEYALIQPQSPNVQISATYNSGTIDNLKIKYLHNLAQTKLFIFYPDKNYFLQRQITTQSNLISNFNNPTQIPLGASGTQCSCLNQDHTLLYILVSSSDLIVYDVTVGSIQSTIATAQIGVSQCYYDHMNYGIVFVVQTATTSQFKLFSLTSHTIAATNSTNYMHFRKDALAIYGTLCSDSVVYVCNLTMTCPDGQFYDHPQYLCVSCPTGCLTCTNSSFCSLCDTNYTIDSNNLCQGNVVNSTNNNTNANSSGNTNVQNLNNETEVNNQSALLTALSFMMNNTAISTVNAVPGGRKALPFLCFLVQIDQLWLYQYHQTYYGQTMDVFFESLQNIENAKWKIISEDKTQKIYQMFGTSKNRISETIDTKVSYANRGFYSTQGKGETFLPACWDFLTFNILFIAIGFCLLRLSFRLLFNYRISIFLRAFSFLVYLSPLLLDGNLQYFFFLMFAQGSLSFSLSPVDKTFNVISTFLFFLVLLFSLISCFLAYFLSRKLAKYVLDNWRTRIHGLLSFSLCKSIRMLIFGALHCWLRSRPSALLPCLAAVEMGNIVILCAVMKNWRAHKIEFKAWYNIVFSLLRILLQGVLYLQQLGLFEQDQILDDLFETILGTILNIYLLTFYIATATEIIYEVTSLFQKPSKQVPAKVEEGQMVEPWANMHIKTKVKRKKNMQKQQKTVSFNTEHVKKGQKLLIKPKKLNHKFTWMVVQKSRFKNK